MFVRLYTGPDGQSHFEDYTLPPGTGSLPLEKGPGVILRRYNPGDYSDWHPVPRRLYMVMLQGGVDIGVQDGTVRRFGPGDVVLGEDLTEKGHWSRAIGHRVAALIYLDE